MGKKLFLGLVGAGALAATIFHKKENFSTEERAKVEESKKYLEEKVKEEKENKNKDEENDHNEHNKEGE